VPTISVSTLLPISTRKSWPFSETPWRSSSLLISISVFSGKASACPLDLIRLVRLFLHHCPGVKTCSECNPPLSFVGVKPMISQDPIGNSRPFLGLVTVPLACKEPIQANGIHESVLRCRACGQSLKKKNDKNR
jgi:hypothetical protein